MRAALIVGALLSVTLAGTVSAHLGDIVYPIYELPTSDLPNLHDSTLEDWEGVLPNASLSIGDFQAQDIGQGTGVDPADLACRVFLAWNDVSQRIYVSIERLDDVYMDPNLGPEGTVFLVDGDHSGGQYRFMGDAYSEEESKRLSYTQAQSYALVPESLDTPQMWAGSAHQWTTQPPWADVGGFQFGESPNYSAVEMAITPWDDLNWRGAEVSRRSSLKAGKIVGFQIHLGDSDEPKRQSGQYLLALPAVMTTVQDGDRTYSHFYFADNFVDGELVPCHRGDCSGATTPVLRDSWGRIKASLR